MPCSAVTLSIATICAIIATALLAIAFSTDNWLHYDVWRNQIQVLRDNTKIAYDWSYIVAWAGIGTCLLASILLSGAAVCLRNEREKEEQLNLQYLMPVYSQKQPPYPPYANYAQQIYPGPYYHGSQYGPYNY
ncbi:GM22856 [Drosophila sechellia]|uniref:GM22856 n=1 Tax=Drosophila sechellia TaxID=7238 RepID=B4I6J8_DROSE|nr:GM22856 [Drosophila sechellia]